MVANDPQFYLCDEKLTMPLENDVLDARLSEIIVSSVEPTLADRATALRTWIHRPLE